MEPDSALGPKGGGGGRRAPRAEPSGCVRTRRQQAAERAGAHHVDGATHSVFFLAQVPVGRVHEALPTPAMRRRPEPGAGTPRRLDRRPARPHSRLGRQEVALARVALRTREHDVGPSRRDRRDWYALYEVATDALIWSPLALLWRLDGTRSAWRVWGMTMATAVGLEAMQLFVYSRISDVTDLFTAAAGAALGVWLGGRLAVREAPGGQALPWSASLPLVMAIGWMALLLFVFWYPFDFRTEGAFLRERLHTFLGRVPFEAYYYGTEFRAATELLHKVLFFIPLGALLAWFVSRLRWTWRGYATFLSLLLIAFAALIVVVGRLAQPEKNPDSMDIVLQWLGGILGFVVIRIFFSRKTLPRHPGGTSFVHAGSQHARKRRRISLNGEGD